MAFTSISHHLLTWYGDREAIRKHYPGLQLYIDYLSSLKRERINKKLRKQRQQTA